MLKISCLKESIKKNCILLLELKIEAERVIKNEDFFDNAYICIPLR